MAIIDKVAREWPHDEEPSRRQSADAVRRAAGPGPPRHFLDIDRYDDRRAARHARPRLRLQERPARPAARRQDPGDDLREAVDPHPRVVRGGDAPARRRHDHPQYGGQPARPRRDRRRHGARAVALCRRDHDPHQPRREARRSGALCHRAGDQRPDRLVAPVPDHGRRDDACRKRRGRSPSTVVAWSGDGNNVAVSWIHAAARFGFDLRLACPERTAARRRRCSTGRGGRAAAST